MADYTHLNLRDDVEDIAPKHGLGGIESHFARNPLGLEKSGVSYYKLEPNFRLPFGHTHTEQEEQHFTELVLQLIDLVDADTRAIVLGKIAGYPTAPAVVSL